MGVQAGRLRARIVIEGATVTTGARGGETENWASLTPKPIASQVSYGTGQERRAAAQESAIVSATFRVRKGPVTDAVTAEHRIQFDGGTWDIVSNVPVPSERQARDITATRRRP